MKKLLTGLTWTAAITTIIMFVASAVTNCWSWFGWTMAGVASAIALVVLFSIFYGLFKPLDDGEQSMFDEVREWWKNNTERILKTLAAVLLSIMFLVGIGFVIYRAPRCAGSILGPNCESTTRRPTSAVETTAVAPPIARKNSTGSGEPVKVDTLTLQAGEQKTVFLPPEVRFFLERASADTMFVTTSDGRVFAVLPKECPNFGTTSTINIRLNQAGMVLVKMYKRGQAVIIPDNC